jgi:SAM-dependent methyltransferase
MGVIEPEPLSAEQRARWEAAYVRDVDAIAMLLGSDGIELGGRRVAVVDSGDGVLALGLAQQLRPAEVVGYDDAGCNTVTLGVFADLLGGLASLPANLRFIPTQPYALPGDRGSFDLVVWWDDLGGRRDPVRMLREIGRLLAPQAHVLLRVPAAGPLGLDQLQHAVLAAGLEPTRVEVDAATVRPDREQLAGRLSCCATRGARMLAFRPSAR